MIGKEKENPTPRRDTVGLHTKKLSWGKIGKQRNRQAALAECQGEFGGQEPVGKKGGRAAVMSAGRMKSAVMEREGFRQF